MKSASRSATMKQLWAERRKKNLGLPPQQSASKSAAKLLWWAERKEKLAAEKEAAEAAGEDVPAVRRQRNGKVYYYKRKITAEKETAEAAGVAVARVDGRRGQVILASIEHDDD